MPEEKKEAKKFESSKAYFERLKLNPEVSKNTFSVQDAIAILEKAVTELKEKRAKEQTVKHILNQAWGLFKVLM